MNTVLMYGPAFDDKGNLVERQVPQGDVPAYVNAGYVIGALPEDVHANGEVKATYTDADAAEQVADIEKPKAKRK